MCYTSDQRNPCSGTRCRAGDITKEKGRLTMKVEDVYLALKELGFGDYVDEVKEAVHSKTL